MEQGLPPPFSGLPAPCSLLRIPDPWERPAHDAEKHQRRADVDDQIERVIAPWAVAADRVVQREREIEDRTPADGHPAGRRLKRDPGRPELPKRGVVENRRDVVELEGPRKTVRIGHQPEDCDQDGHDPGTLPGFPRASGDGRAAIGRGRKTRLTDSRNKRRGQVTPPYNARHRRRGQVTPPYNARRRRRGRVTPPYNARRRGRGRVTPPYNARRRRRGRVTPPYNARHRRRGRVTPPYNARHRRRGRVTPPYNGGFVGSWFWSAHFATRLGEIRKERLADSAPGRRACC